MARIIGNEGKVTFGTHSILANAWSMSVSRVVSDVTAYDDDSSRVTGGMPTYTGSVSGFLEKGATDTSPELRADKFATGTVVAVTLYATEAGSDCKYTCSTCVVSGVSINVSKTGDTTVSFDFTASGGFVEAWT
jgi:hypothetical protein